ncbi:SDR family NAD(P)-dependent oxidoreductase [Paenibacillus kandeliae]|uniref:SDR family NAD(P)-dependent oxidoreductase n=1 Tax=Paenibacillus kandeliae TaxID=3231269 RepID=UPI003458445F
MSSALVVGATGGTGRVIVEELLRREIAVIAFGRSSTKLQQMAAELGDPALLYCYAGDAFQTEEVQKAAEGVEVIFQCASVPYHEMNDRQLPLGQSVLQAAETLGIKLVVVDGIYPYSIRSSDEPITEDYPKHPPTVKGRTKLALEQLIFDARWQSLQAMIVRLPDYYGPSANQASYIFSTLQSIADGKIGMFIGNTTIAREYVYLPDAAHMIVELACREQAYGQNWHIPSAGPIHGKALIALAREAAHKGSKPVIPLGKWSLQLLGTFVPVMKEIVEMLYLTEKPLLLSGRKYEQHIGDIPRTSYEEGIAITIQHLQQ